MEGVNTLVSIIFERAAAAAVCTLLGELGLSALANTLSNGFWNAGGATVSLSA